MAKMHENEGNYINDKLSPKYELAHPASKIGAETSDIQFWIVSVGVAVVLLGNIAAIFMLYKRQNRIMAERTALLRN